MGVVTNSNPSGDSGTNLFIIGGNDLYSVDRSTGAATLIGPGTYSEIFGLAFTNNTMYAIEASGTGIFALNLTNGNSTLVSNYDPSIVGKVEAAAAFTFASVPEPSSVLLPGLGGLGLLCWRWRSRHVTKKGTKAALRFEK